MDQLVPGGKYVVLLPLGVIEEPYATKAATMVQQQLASEGAEVSVIALGSDGPPVIVEIMASDPDEEEPAAPPFPTALEEARLQWLTAHPRPDLPGPAKDDQ